MQPVRVQGSQRPVEGFGKLFAVLQIAHTVNELQVRQPDNEHVWQRLFVSFKK